MTTSRIDSGGPRALAERRAAAGVERAATGRDAEAELTGRRRAIARATLVGLGLSLAATGAWALFAPSSFYGEFPFGRGWVEVLPAYNQHLTTDVGALYLATSAMLFGAAWAFEKRTVVVACIAWLAFALPHTIYHAFHLEPYATADAIANGFANAAAVLLPAWVLVAVLRAGRARPLQTPAKTQRAGGGARTPAPERVGIDAEPRATTSTDK